MLINLKIHSAYNNFFEETLYSFEATVVYDIIAYLRGVHPKFSKYIKQVISGESSEPFCLLDSNLKPITADMVDIKRFKDGDTIHLVPAIAGGGGKSITKAIYVVFAAVAIYQTIGYLAAAGAAPGAGAGIGAEAGATAEAIAAQQTASAAVTLTPLQMAGLQIGLSAVSMLMTKSPAARSSKQTESTSRDNDMFGSLKNSSTSGTPIPLIYGRHRVAGQFMSGYITTIGHGGGDQVNVGSQFDGV